jgi:hypothetical protein
LRVTVEGISKVVDRIQTAGLIRRESDLADRGTTTAAMRTARMT